MTTLSDLKLVPRFWLLMIVKELIVMKNNKNISLNLIMFIIASSYQLYNLEVKSDVVDDIFYLPV